MRRLLFLVLVAAGAWSGYWLYGSWSTQRALSGWLDARAAEGWVANYADLRTRGYPNRFDTTVTDLELADPETGLAWTAPLFQILSLSYQQNHVIAVWPGTQTFAWPAERLTVEAESMQGSIVFEPGDALVLDRSAVILEQFELSSTAGWAASVDEGRFATRQTAARALSHDIGFEARGVRPAAGLRTSLDPAGLLPDSVEALRVDATLGFDRPWDRLAIEDTRPAITELELNDLRATWGKLELRAAGDLVVDGRGVPEGQITVKATNWREMLDVAVAAGVLPEALRSTLETGLELLAALNGPPETLDAPLSFRNGRVSFGPIPLGPAPKLRLR